MKITKLISAIIIITATFANGATFNVSNVPSFQTALTTAGANGEADVINVATGFYNITTSLSYAGEHSLSIIGEGANSTILDGGHAVQVMNIDSSTEGNIFVAGLTFQNGSNNVGGITVGGGLSVVCNDSCSAIIASCVFSNNFVGFGGGGAYVAVNNGSATVTNCIATLNSTEVDDAGGISVYKEAGNNNIIVSDNIFYDNHLFSNPGSVGDVEGSGFYVYYLGTFCNITISNNLAYGNTLESGAGTLYIRATQGANINISDNTFSNNIATTRGGGIDIELETGNINIKRNKLINNSVTGTEGDGGGVAVTFNTSGTFEFSDNIVVGNTATRHGGGANFGLGNGITSAEIIQNIFVNNHAGITDGVGGGLQINSECDVTLINNTFFGNVSSDSGAGGFGFYAESAADSASLYNEIYMTNLPDSVSIIGTGPIAAQYSNIENGGGKSYFGIGCIDSDPLFLNPAFPAGADGIYATAEDGLQLTESSPSVNTGSTSAVPAEITYDLIGNTRIYDGAVDMGCYEFVPEPVGIMWIFGFLVMKSRTTKCTL